MKYFLHSLFLIAILSVISFSAKSQLNARGLYFDGGNDYVTIPYDSSYTFDSGEMTLEFWYQFQSFQGALTDTLFDNLQNGGLQITFDSTGLVRVYYNGVSSIFVSSWSYTAGECEHIAVVINKYKFQLFFNGNLFGSFTMPISTPLGYRPSTHSIKIGGKNFKGFIHEIRLWNTTRSQLDIQANINQQLAGNEPGLLGYWKCDHVVTQILTDYTTHQNHGQLGSTPLVDSNDPSFAIGCNSCYPNNGISSTKDFKTCLGDSITLKSISTLIGNTYEWKQNGILLPNETNDSLVVREPGLYELNISHNQCTAAPKSVIIEYAKNTWASISTGNYDDLCPGGLSTLFASSGKGYQWYRDGLALPSETYQNLIVDTIGSYFCKVDDGCGFKNSNTITLSYHPYIGFNYIPNLFCSSTSPTLYTFHSNATSPTYSWYLDGNLIANASADTLASSSPGTYSVVMNTPSCGTNTAEIDFLGNNPPCNSIHVRHFSNCDPASYITPYSQLNVYPLVPSDLGAGHTYWTNENGTVFHSDMFSILSSGIYVASTEYSCGTCVTDSVYYDCLPVSHLILNYSNLCVTRVLKVSSVWKSIQWQRDSINLIGETRDSLVLTSSGNYRCVVTNGCGVQYSENIAVSFPNANLNTHVLQICENDTMVLYIPKPIYSGQFPVTWSMDGSTIDFNTDTLRYRADSHYFYHYITVLVGWEPGCYQKDSCLLIIDPDPNCSISTANLPSFCPGSTDTISSYTTQTNSYQWLLNGVNIPGATSTNVITGTYGDYTMLASNVNGCTTLSDTITLVQAPNPSLNVNDTIAFCTNEPVVVKTIHSPYNSVDWYENGILIPGAHLDSIAIQNTGTYFAILTDSRGCMDTTATINATAFIPSTASITPLPDTICNSSIGIPLTGNPTGGAFSGLGVIGNYFFGSAANPGLASISYTIIDSNSCTSTASDTFFIEICSGIEDVQLTSVSIFPNPTSSGFSMKTNTLEPYRIYIRDMSGRIVFDLENKDKNWFDLSSFPEGVYFLELITSHETIRKQIVKMK